MDKKTSFVLYPAEFLAAVHNFKKNQICDLIIAMCEFNLYGSVSLKLSGIIQDRFNTLQETIDLNNAKYLEICEKRKVSGSKGGSKRQAKIKQTPIKIISPPPTEMKKENESETDNEDENKDKEPEVVYNSGYVGAPTIEEVSEYCQSSGYTIDPVAFVKWNEARGWMNGKKYIAVDWRRAVRKWFCKENNVSYSEMESMANICSDVLSKVKVVQNA